MKITLYACALFIVAPASAMEKLWLTPALVDNKCTEAPDRIQIHVTNQFEVPASETDCAYHALCNGLTIAQIIRSVRPEKRAELLSSLTDFSKKKSLLFGSQESSWKKTILERRALPQIKSELKYQLLKALKVLQDAQEYAHNPERGKANPLHWIPVSRGGSVYFKVVCKTEEERTLFVKLEGIIDLVVAELTSAKQISYFQDTTYAHETISTLLEEILGTKLDENKKNLDDFAPYEALSDAGILSYFNLKNINIPYPSDPEKGSWLTSAEIKVLLGEDYTKKCFEYGIEPAEVLILGDSQVANMPMKYDPALAQNDFKALRKKLAHPSDNALAVIVLFTPFEGSPKGHWYTLVVNKIGSHIQYILADSANDHPRLAEPRLDETIALLLGKVEPENPPLEAIANQASAEAAPKKSFSFISTDRLITVIMACAAIIIVACIVMLKQKNDSKKRKKSKV